MKARMELAETQSLRLAIERSLRGAFDPEDVLPRLLRLSRLAPASSDEGIFAHHKLAELLVEQDPWRAALFVRRALAYRPHDDRLWAVLALSQTLLGNFRCARKAYVEAIACAPSNPWYAHNLGHLLDVALGEPTQAAPWLASAYRAKSDNSEIAASYAHALARSGRKDEARRVLEAARGRFDSRELDALLRWIDDGAKARGQRGALSVGSGRRRPAPKTLVRVLARGLSHLPLDARQRERALAIARDAAVPARGDLAGLAAAVAYAIVYVDHVPLSHAEVAAPFRVGVADLRGRFAELRAQLDIIRGDIRYATARPGRT